MNVQNFVSCRQARNDWQYIMFRAKNPKELLNAVHRYATLQDADFYYGFYEARFRNENRLVESVSVCNDLDYEFEYYDLNAERKLPEFELIDRLQHWFRSIPEIDGYRYFCLENGGTRVIVESYNEEDVAFFKKFDCYNVLEWNAIAERLTLAVEHIGNVVKTLIQIRERFSETEWSRHMRRIEKVSDRLNELENVVPEDVDDWQVNDLNHAAQYVSESILKELGLED